MAFNIIPPQVPFTTADGRIAREWYIFLLNLFESNGGGNNALTQDQFETLFLAGMRMPNNSPIETALRDIAATQQSQHDAGGAIQSLARRLSELESLVGATAGRSPLAATANSGAPTAKVGLTAVTGVAATFMLSDSAPALSQTISPTWTGNHTFAPTTGSTLFSNGDVGIGTATPTGLLSVSSINGGDGVTVVAWGAGYSVFGPNAGSTTGAALGLGYDTTNDRANIVALAPAVAWKPLHLFAGGIDFKAKNGMSAGNISSAGAWTFAGSLTVKGQATTGAQTATFTATNKPGSATSAPLKWLPITLDGTAYYVPCWT